MAGYRDTDSYIAKDPKKRENQLGNLKGINPRKRGGGNRKKTDNIQDALPDIPQDISIVDFAQDPDYCGITLHTGQRAALKAIYGIPLNEEEMPYYMTMTGRAPFVDFDGTEYAPQFSADFEGQHNEGGESEEIIISVGGRAGKSTVITTIMALYETIARGGVWREYLQPNETGYAVVVATRQDQAKDIIQKQCARVLESSPILSQFLAEEPKTLEISLLNGLKIISLPCNSTAGRGIPVYFFCLDEVAHFRVEGVNTGESVYHSISPRLAQFPGAKTVMVSTPAAKQGLFWDMFAEGFNVPDRTTLQAPTRVFNPTYLDKFYARMKRTSDENYEREFLGRFAERMSTFFPQDALNAAYVLDEDLDRTPNTLYYGAIDQSGLTGKDRFGFAIAHMDSTGAVFTDVVRSWDSSSLDEIMADISVLSRQYGLTTIYRDRYAAGWVDNALQKIGVEITVRPPLPVVYTNAKSLLISGKLCLKNTDELRSGMDSTVAYYGKNNTMSIEHPRTQKGHADMADAAVTAVYGATVHPNIRHEKTARILNYDTRQTIGSLMLDI